MVLKLMSLCQCQPFSKTQNKEADETFTDSFPSVFNEIILCTTNFYLHQVLSGQICLKTSVGNRILCLITMTLISIYIRFLDIWH